MVMGNIFGTMKVLNNTKTIKPTNMIDIYYTLILYIMINICLS